MASAPMRVLFAPVSSAEGIGECMRSAIIADAIQACWPDADIRFLLNKAAPFAQTCAYQTHLLDETPTKCTKAVNQFVTDFKPHIMVFDASGRASQLAHAKKTGAKVIFLSQHKRKRSRGMKLNRARHTDFHGVVQPDFVIGDISAFDKFKLNMLHLPKPVNLGPIFSQPQTQAQKMLLAELGLASQKYILFNAGSGGHYVDGKLAADTYYQAAQKCTELINLPCVVVFGVNYPKPLPENDKVMVLNNLPNSGFINLLDASQFAVISGGDTMLQAIALKKPIIATPVSKDQPTRIDICFKQKLIKSCQTDSDSIVKQILELVESRECELLKKNLQSIKQYCALDRLITEVESLIDI
ncbi:hypothetical protein [Shewanella maritima]|uniref:hypothetical protein n=1 Tax=Shewanella maritima TaxID=2520507 RepID=UPI00373672C1